MPDLLGSVGSFLNANSGALKGLATAASTGSNIYSGVTNALNTNNYNNAQSYVQNLVKDPTKMAAAAAQYQQPLSAGLTDAVTNQTQAQLAERGLGGSSTATAAAISQALAPYIQQNQTTAMQSLMNSLGLISGTKPSTLPTMDMSKLMSLLKTGSTPSMQQTAFSDMQAPPTLELDSGVMPEDYAASYGT